MFPSVLHLIIIWFPSRGITGIEVSVRSTCGCLGYVVPSCSCNLSCGPYHSARSWDPEGVTYVSSRHLLPHTHLREHRYSILVVSNVAVVLHRQPCKFIYQVILVYTILDFDLYHIILMPLKGWDVSHYLLSNDRRNLIFRSQGLDCGSLRCGLLGSSLLSIGSIAPSRIHESPTCHLIATWGFPTPSSMTAATL